MYGVPSEIRLAAIMERLPRKPFWTPTLTSVLNLPSGAVILAQTGGVNSQPFLLLPMSFNTEFSIGKDSQWWEAPKDSRRSRLPTTKREVAKKRDSLDHLSFVAMNGKRHPRNFWNVTSTGDYGMDCELGREYARQFLLHQVMDLDGCRRLAWIVLDMMESFQPGAKGIIIGFLGEIEDHAVWSQIVDQILLHHPAVQVSSDKTAWPLN